MPTKKTMLAVIEFDVDDGCDRCDLDNVPMYLEIQLQKGDEYSDLHFPDEPTYRLSGLAVYDTLGDLQQDIAAGVANPCPEIGADPVRECLAKFADLMEDPQDWLDNGLNDLSPDDGDDNHYFHAYVTAEDILRAQQLLHTPTHENGKN